MVLQVFLSTLCSVELKIEKIFSRKVSFTFVV